MKTVKQTAEHTIQQRRDGRYAVRGKDRKWINGDDKVEILVKEGLLKQDKAKPKAEEPSPAEESTEGAAGEAGEETS